MNITKLKLLVISLICLTAVSPRTAQADGIQLTLSAVSGSPGQKVTVSGTIANTGASPIFLNGENFNLGSLNLIDGDVTDFFNNAPLSLNGKTDSGLISLFSFDIAPGTPVGLYTPNFLQILGGPGISDTIDIADAPFSVDVHGTSVPEPATSVLLVIPISMILTISSLGKWTKKVLGVYKLILTR